MKYSFNKLIVIILLITLCFPVYANNQSVQRHKSWIEKSFLAVKASYKMGKKRRDRIMALVAPAQSNIEKLTEARDLARGTELALMAQQRLDIAVVELPKITNAANIAAEEFPNLERALNIATNIRNQARNSRDLAYLKILWQDMIINRSSAFQSGGLMGRYFVRARTASGVLIAQVKFLTSYTKDLFILFKKHIQLNKCFAELAMPFITRFRAIKPLGVLLGISQATFLEFYFAFLALQELLGALPPPPVPPGYVSFLPTSTVWLQIIQHSRLNCSYRLSQYGVPERSCFGGPWSRFTPADDEEEGIIDRLEMQIVIPEDGEED